MTFTRRQLYLANLNELFIKTNEKVTKLTEKSYIITSLHDYILT